MRWRQPLKAFKTGAGHLDVIALQIARQWNRQPDWFYTLSIKDQTKLLALHRIEHTPAKDLKQNKKDSKDAKMRAAIKRYANRDSING
jgi:hypothetical protein